MGRIASLAIATVFIFGLLVASLLYLVSSNFARSVTEANDRLRWIDSTNHALALMLSCEAAQRGYLLTGKSEYLQPYQDAVPAITVELEHLKTLGEQRPELENRIAAIRGLVQSRLDELTRTIRKMDSGATVPRNEILPSEDSAAMDRLRKVIDAMKADEMQLWSSRVNNAAANAEMYRNLAIFFALLDFAAVVFMRWLLKRYQRLEELVTFCAWSNRVQYEGKWVPVEQFLSKRFGLKISHGLAEDIYERLIAQHSDEMPLHERAETAIVFDDCAATAQKVAS